MMKENFTAIVRKAVEGVGLDDALKILKRSRNGDFDYAIRPELRPYLVTFANALEKALDNNGFLADEELLSLAHDLSVFTIDIFDDNTSYLCKALRRLRVFVTDLSLRGKNQGYTVLNNKYGIDVIYSKDHREQIKDIRFRTKAKEFFKYTDDKPYEYFDVLIGDIIACQKLNSEKELNEFISSRRL